MKALNVVCPHPEIRDNKETGKTYWKQVGTALVGEDLAAYMREKNEKIRILPNDSPGVTFIIFPEKDFDEDKKSKW